MTSERWQKIEAIFGEAVKLEGEKRLSYLEEACSGDTDLRVEVESLLACDVTGGPLDGSALECLDTQEIDSAVAEWHGEAKAPGPAAAVVVEPKPARGTPVNAELTTIGPLQKKGQADPVVGWLVCVKGPAFGQDYPIRSERNRIGRDSLMDICVAGDNRISRDSHAIITYDPRHNQFRLSPGLARGIVYLNGRMLDASTSLDAYDMIELGETSLQFVPFCGERFTWK
jgi:hypothetical protein